MESLGQPWAIVDIETNGLSHFSGKVIEIGVIRVEGNRIVDEFQSLVNPGGPLPQFISNLTGISTEEVLAAPDFESVEPRLSQIMDGALMVAHNARFDYSFIKQEYARLGQAFKPKLMCTVRLSKKLNPQHRRHGLEHIINRYNLELPSRHRAYDDALAVWKFIELMQNEFTPDVFSAAVKSQFKRQALPSHLSDGQIDGLPDSPGVYIFEDEAGKPIYIGKSVNIKKRVLSHFTADQSEEKELKMSQLVRNISAISTNGELEALLLENQMVKELSPVYNRKLRNLRQMTVAVKNMDDAGYLKINFLEKAEIDPSETGDLLGIFRSRRQAASRLEDLAKTFELCPRLLGLQAGKGRCFWSQLGRCRGACGGLEPAEVYNRRLLIAFDSSRVRQWPYRSPILVKEFNGEQNSSAVIIDQWCIVAQLKQEAYGEVTAQPVKRRFDLDIYRILQSFLSKPAASAVITPITNRQLQSLLG